MPRQRFFILRFGGLSVLVVLCAVSASLGSQRFSRSVEYCPLNIRYEDLATIIQRIQESYRVANAGVETEDRQNVTLAAGDFEIAIENDFSGTSLKQGPQVANEVRYRYYNLNNNSPISDVSLRLGDYSRELSVVGLDRTQVDSLVSLISRDFELLGCSIGGSGFRVAGSFIFISVAAVLSLVAGLKQVQISSKVALLVVALTIYAVLLLLPWSAWLPGTAVRAGEISFIARHTPAIGLISLLLGIVSIALTVRQTIKARESRQITQENTESGDTST